MQIYLTKNIVNNKMYIGKDSKSDPKYLGSGTILKQAIKKYGKDNFEKIILKDNINNEIELNNWEDFYITFFNAVSSKQFYNLIPGGQGQCCIPIYKFNKEGSLICKYESIEEAAKDNNIKNKGNICLVADGKRNYTGGFRWSYNTVPMPLLNNKIGRKKGTKNSWKIERKHTNIHTFEIEIYDKNMNLLKTVIGYKEAAEYTKLSHQMISKKCRSGEFYKSYFFKKGKEIHKTIIKN